MSRVRLEGPQHDAKQCSIDAICNINTAMLTTATAAAAAAAAQDVWLRQRMIQATRKQTNLRITETNTLMLR